MDRRAKEALRVKAGEFFEKATAAIVAEYRGLKVDEITELRRQVRGLKGEFKVIKNRVAKKALEHEAKDSAGISPRLKGPVGIAFLFGDAAPAAKYLLKFEEEHPNFVVTGGIVSGDVMDKAGLKAVSNLPSREVLLARAIGSIVAPHRGLLGVLNGVQRNLVTVLSAIRDKKQG